jgi:dolichyl-phosphate-mannose--protein O-mannosyl transferase
VLSRLGLLDIFLAFFLLCGVHCVVADRQWFRARLAAGATRALVRPWLLAGGVSFGLAAGTKWTAIYPLAAFGLMAFAWSAGARRSFGQRRVLLRSVLLDGVPAFVHLVLVALVVYVATWTGWLIHAHEYEKTFSNTQYTAYGGGKAWPTASEPDASGLGEVTQSLRSLWHYHHDVYAFHSHFLNDSEHTYQSRPAGWLLMNRPVGVDAQLDIKPGSQGCAAPAGSTCLRQVLLLGNPLLWWGGTLALMFAAVMWLAARDWRFGVAVVGTGSTWLPWLLYDDRPIFLFYAIACLPFVVLATVLAMGKLIGPSDAPSPRRTAGVVVAGSWFVLVLLAFAWFWPIWTDQLITHAEWVNRVWFSRWI